MQTRMLGRSGLEVSALGFGCMGLSFGLGQPVSRADGIAVLRAAVDAGVTFFDTAEAYGPFANETLVGEALAPVRDQVVIATKFGFKFEGGKQAGLDSRPAHIREVAEASLARLGVETIDLFYQHRVDPAVPIEDTVGAIAEMVKAGYVRHIGLSEAGSETIRRAQAVHPIVDLQIEYSLFSRGIEAGVLPTCRELGIGITAYGVLSRGLLSGHWSKDRAAGVRDFRAFSPRFQGENLDRNLALVDALRAVAASKGVTVAQAAIAWVLSRGEDIVPLIGARRRDRLAESLGALDVHLSADDLARIEQAVPAEAVAGDRYNQHAMAQLDSERG
jgi:pyridoxine 4-dehydrogenase